MGQRHGIENDDMVLLYFRFAIEQANSRTSAVETSQWLGPEAPVKWRELYYAGFTWCRTWRQYMNWRDLEMRTLQRIAREIMEEKKNED